jgi:hypothetical protein
MPIPKAANSNNRTITKSRSPAFVLTPYKLDRIVVQNV